jgi:hypothetical protein
VARYLKTARGDGNLRDVILWQSRLKKLDRRIAQYGLQRYAERP